MTEHEYWATITSNHDECLLRWYKEKPKAFGALIFTESAEVEGRILKLVTKVASLETEEELMAAARTIVKQKNMLLRTLVFKPHMFKDAWIVTGKDGVRTRAARDILSVLEDGERYPAVQLSTMSVDGGVPDLDDWEEIEQGEEKEMLYLYPKPILMAFISKMMLDHADLLGMPKVKVLTEDEAIKIFGKDKVAEMKEMAVGKKGLEKALDAPKFEFVDAGRVEPIPMPKIDEKDQII
jgi:hypothetical protein